ncbi:MAG TPA: response regulator, partial [Minicystis sp.]|nr:response regulator [Minicystis sp.]
MQPADDTTRGVTAGGDDAVPPIRVLLLEDDALDAELLAACLDASGFAASIERVDTRDAFEAALARGGFDVVLSDFSLPSYDGTRALQATRALAPDVPFLFVSGAIGEELAIESLRRGATDYVLKHRLDRLGPALRRALREREDRIQR